MAIANVLQLECRPTSRHLFLANSVLHMCTSCYFAVSDQNYEIAIRFSDRDFLKQSNYLAIRRRFQTVNLTFDPLTLNMCIECQTLYEI